MLVCYYTKQSNAYEVAKLLILYNANINYNISGETPLSTVIHSNRINKDKLLELLLSNNANPNVGEGQKTNLLWSCTRDNNDITGNCVLLMLKYNADINRLCNIIDQKNIILI